MINIVIMTNPAIRFVPFYGKYEKRGNLLRTNKLSKIYNEARDKHDRYND